MASCRRLLIGFLWGGQSWLQPAFSRLQECKFKAGWKAGCGQDCPPHLLPHRNRITQIHRSAAFTNIIPIPRGDFHFHIALNYGLATETRSQRISGGQFHPIDFVVFLFREVFGALGNNDVAGSARAAPATGMFHRDTKVQTNVEKRFGFSVFVIRKLALFVLNSLPVNRYLWHILLYRSAQIPRATAY